MNNADIRRCYPALEKGVGSCVGGRKRVCGDWLWTGGGGWVLSIYIDGCGLGYGYVSKVRSWCCLTYRFCRVEL